MSGARSSKRWLSLAPFALVTLFGCAQIIGLDDYTVGGSVPSGNTGNAGKAGSTSGDAGETGDAGSVSASGNGAGGSKAGSGPVGDAGAAGTVDVPQIVGCDGKTEFTPNERILRSCILRAGCNPSFNPVRSVSTCVTYDTQAALPGESCNLESETCADYEACEHIGVAHDDLCGGTKKTRCDGDIAVNCDNYTSGDRFFDCAALGGTCGLLTYSDTDATVYADCLLDVAPDSCAAEADDDSKYYCHTGASEDLRYYCWEGKAWGATCSSLAYCQDDAATTGDATCYYNLQTCTGPAVPTCNGNIANVCSSGSLFRYNCGAVGLGCNITDTYEYCLAPGCTATDVDTDCVEHCSPDGNSLTLCYGGAPVTVKCSDYGFTQCLTHTDDNGTTDDLSDDKTYAACRY